MRILVILMLGFLLMPATVEAVRPMVYTRGSKIRKHSNNPNRFQYLHPSYSHRRTPKRPPCRSHGLSRCLDKQFKKRHYYSHRYRNGMRRTPKPHPYIRYRVKRKVIRMN